MKPVLHRKKCDPRHENAAKPDQDQLTLPTLAAGYCDVRAGSLALIDQLCAEDLNLQSMPQVSPAKWHLGHTTWFFETFVLADFDPAHRWHDPAYAELFNSYYHGVGRQHPRARRGLLSRPTLAQVLHYREVIDAKVRALIDAASGTIDQRLADRLVLGMHHEQQHQELMITDLKHAFSFNPLAPALGQPPQTVGCAAAPPDWYGYESGLYAVGHAGPGFCFDNETPRHQHFVNRPFELAGAPVSVAQYLEFIEDGGYREPRWWLSDGWAWVQQSGADAPLYWQRADGRWCIPTLSTEQALDPAAPVCHLGYYEAAAYAQWAGARLPTEFEWEIAAATVPVDGQLADCGRFHPEPAGDCAHGPAAMFGHVWEWTASAYAAYPGFRPDTGAVGEYNGKFMANQMVLRGGSCATPTGHIRASYRNFFYPYDRWQFSGLRLARDAD